MLNLEQHGAEHLDHAREPGRLRLGRQFEFASRCNDDVIGVANQRRAAAPPCQKGIAGRQLTVHLERCRLESWMDNTSIAAELSHDPVSVRVAGGSCRRRNHEDEREESERQLVHGSTPIVSARV